MKITAVQMQNRNIFVGILRRKLFRNTAKAMFRISSTQNRKKIGDEFCLSTKMIRSEN